MFKWRSYPNPKLPPAVTRKAAGILGFLPNGR